MAYTVQKLAKLSGVSVRTLHYYDEIGLLKPAYTAGNGYRYYEEKEVLLLQQILFFRNLGFELKQIQKVIKKSDFDQIAALHSHRKVLVQELDRTRELIQTIDDTIEHLQGLKKMKDNQFFKGLNSPKQKEYEKYLIDSGKVTAEEIEKGRKKFEKWTEEDWKRTQELWDQLIRDYVAAIEKGETPGSPVAMGLVRRHFLYLDRCFGIKVQKEEIVEKSQFYLGHPDWKKKFDGYHPKLHEFILAAMEAFAQQ